MSNNWFEGKVDEITVDEKKTTEKKYLSTDLNKLITPVTITYSDVPCYLTIHASTSLHIHSTTHPLAVLPTSAGTLMSPRAL